MDIVECDKCNERFKPPTSSYDNAVLIIPNRLCPIPLRRVGDTHLCRNCEYDLQEIITEWFGFMVDRLWLKKSNNSQLKVYGIDDDDSP